MTVHNFSKSNSIYNNFLAQLRDLKVQKDRLRFRRNLERLGEITAYEVSKELQFKEAEIYSPLGVAKSNIIEEQPVIATILRAGLPLHQGFLNYFDSADNCFISAYRKHTNNEDFDVEIEYMSSPSVDGKVVILTDPMIASGASMVLAYKALLSKGKPKHVHVVGVISSLEGINYVKQHMPENTTIWIGAIDEEMTAQSYIVPGLGDAGDLAFGEKMDY
ncbi:MAG: uracil phosphoribosyltransferase [Flavobacteriales bacterium]|nr:uracil phosphoribosyltransferase [Flavobacteriales bacterium]